MKGTVVKTMPDVSQAEIGRRMYPIPRGKQVEQAMKLMQQGTGPEWRALQEDEIRLWGPSCNAPGTVSIQRNGTGSRLAKSA